MISFDGARASHRTTRSSQMEYFSTLRGKFSKRFT